MKENLRQIYRGIRAHVLQRVIPRSTKQLPKNHKPTIEVIGFFRSISGIGESARLCAQQLAADGFTVKCTSVESFFRKPYEMDWSWSNTIEDEHIECRIYHLNPPMLPPVIFQMGLSNFKKTFNIGYWAWELETIPDEWVRAIRYMNAIITPSEFTTNVIKRYADYPVLTATHPVTLTAPEQGMRQTLSIPDDAFLVSTIFSFGSAMERKNPLGLITAFNAAFATEKNAYLVLKSNTGNDSPEKRELLAAIAKHPNIKLIDQHWTRAQILGLIQSSDIYASLHRSEGFGLTIAEAMLLGTPTMVTAWSGNMDFCTNTNSFLINYKPIAVKSTHPEFTDLKNATWADADIHQATSVLQEAYRNRDLIGTKKVQCTTDMQACIASHKYEKALQELTNN